MSFFFPARTSPISRCGPLEEEQTRTFHFDIFDTRAEKVTLSRWEGSRCWCALLNVKFKSFYRVVVSSTWTLVGAVISRHCCRGFGHCTKSNLETYKLIISAILYITNAAVQKLLQRFKPFPLDQRVPQRNELKREKKSMVSRPRRRSQW